MSKQQIIDYEHSGLSIWRAMLDHGKHRSKNERGPLRIRWGAHLVQTADVFQVPRRGNIRMEYLRYDERSRQGFDVKMRGGCVLRSGDLVPILRTWCDPDGDGTLEYEYIANDGLISTWNVYEMKRGDEVVAEKWTGNAGMWVEVVTNIDRIYHCSPGPATSPDFDSLIYRLTVTGAAD